FPHAIVDLVGRLKVKETAAVLERCAIFVGNDSGPMHLAAAVGTPVVAAFGPSDARTYHPWGVPHRIIKLDLSCLPCDFINCSQGENICLTHIPVEDLLQACLEMLNSKIGVEKGA
ncbi:MAG: glycosyltransferase family 9 protein, partial [Dehalococcoidia bacterium]|nr:glycosyltransferase family 9 protein [Dehalococcoidia bacterium]